MKMNIAAKKHECAKRIQVKLGMQKPPGIEVLHRIFKKNGDPCCYGINPGQYQTGVTESLLAWSNLYDGDFRYPMHDLYDVYPQVFRTADKNKKIVPLLTEVVVNLGGIKISAGYNYMIVGEIAANSGFLTVNSLAVRELFTSCGLASLIKLDEIQIARKRRCSFIHTWHVFDNPNFNSAIIPSLKNGFILYQEKRTKGLGYKGDGSIHLRKYFKDDQVSEVFIEGHKEPIITPDQNDIVIKVLISSKRKHKGKVFKKIITKPRD